MLDWRNELKKHVAKKIKEMTGEDIPIENIHTLELETSLDYSEFSVEELANMYAFALMKEDFEDAEKISNELKQKNVEIKMNIDEKNHTGVIDFCRMKENSVGTIEIKLKVLPDGIMIDFEEEII